MKRIFQLICLLLVANCAMACSNTENDVPLGPIGETPAEEDPDAEHIYLWPEGKRSTGGRACTGRMATWFWCARRVDRMV